MPSNQMVTSLGIILLTITCVQSCPSDIIARTQVCAAILKVKVAASPSNIQSLCPDYFLTKDCILHAYNQCNTTVQGHVNQTYLPVTNYFDQQCSMYNKSAISPPNPVCNMTRIYDEVKICVASVQHTLKYNKPTTLAARDAFCAEYRTAWTCSMNHITPCQYAATFFQGTMDKIKEDIAPHCSTCRISSFMLLPLLSILLATEWTS